MQDRLKLVSVPQVSTLTGESFVSQVYKKDRTEQKTLLGKWQNHAERQNREEYKQ